MVSSSHFQKQETEREKREEEYELMFPEQVADAAVLQPYEARVYKRVK